MDFDMNFGSCPLFAIANETLDKPIRFVRRTLVVATRAPKEIAAINVKLLLLSQRQPKVTLTLQGSDNPANLLPQALS